jgi:hypothetical protein
VLRKCRENPSDAEPKGSEHPASLTVIAVLAQKAPEEPHSPSAIPLILEGGERQDWMPPENHPLHRKFQEMELNWIGRLYHAQKQLLDAGYEKKEIAIYVSSFQAVEKQGSEKVSFCVRGERIDALLPVTQKVGSMREGC